MHISENVAENLRFLCVEVDSQLLNLQRYMRAPADSLMARIVDRGGYTSNLKTRIHNNCLAQLAACTDACQEAMTLRSIELVATNLERISELCRQSVKQLNGLGSLRHADPDVYLPMLKRVRRGIGLVEPAIEDNDTRQALKISELKEKLDRDCSGLLDRYTKALKRRKDTEDLIQALFVARAVEQMGDALLEISESIVSANLGQPVNMERYRALRASLDRFELRDDAEDVQIQVIAQTRSGSSISGIAATGGSREGYSAIFKEGEKRKLKEERQGVESWHEIFPGLAPRILSYKKRGQSASLLIEHLPGLTFEQIVINEKPRLIAETLDHLASTLTSVWTETQTEHSVSAGFIDQLRKRMSDVYKIHPEFQDGAVGICGLKIPSFGALVDEAQVYEQQIKAPFSVYIHGDFNLDNIIYDPIEQRINFIDLHRSQYLDYVQDVSVFMVSNYRLQILDLPHRRRIMKLATDFYAVARQYADSQRDKSFDLRLALGLARSFVTSTRFILDKSLASRMFMRARYLLELALNTAPEKAHRFELPIKEIFVG